MVNNTNAREQEAVDDLKPKGEGKPYCGEPRYQLIAETMARICTPVPGGYFLDLAKLGYLDTQYNSTLDFLREHVPQKP